MKLSGRLLLGVIVFSATVRLFSQSHTPAETAVLKADQDWSVVFSAKDLDKSVAAVADDGTVAAPNAPLANGPTEVRALFKGMLALPSMAISWQATHVEVAKSGEMAFTSGEYQLSFATPDGKTVKDHGKYVTVWHRGKDGEWRVLRDIFNSDLPLPGGAN
jgi:ketosteroid isomerase-like protein